MTRQLSAIFGVLITLCFAVAAAAQPATVRLSGRVSDPQQAPVAGATITAHNLATALETTTTSGSDGRYTLASLPPGRYDIEVKVDGFSIFRTERLVLAVGQDRELDVPLTLRAVQETIVVAESGHIVTTTVDGVVDATRIESLPLNGRNFLELSLLVPGNQPTPTFDPTKTNSVLISSAGQLGRGGNISIDAQDNNDDVVGGPLMNLPIEAVQEFQIATNRFGAELGRSASSAINVVTRSGSNRLRGSASLFARDGSWTARPATLDESAASQPFDRQQVSGSLGGPLVRDKAFWFASGEFRNQDGAVLVGRRDTATRAIPTSYAPAPLDDGLWLLRSDINQGTSRFMVRYAGEQATDTAASALERAIGSETQRQTAKNRYHGVLGSWTRSGSAAVNDLHVSVSTYHNDTKPVATLPQYTFPSIQDGASFRMPQETEQTRLQVADSASFVRGPHTFGVGGMVERIDALFNLGVFQQGRIELVEDFPSFDHNGDGRVDDNDLLFAVTLRSGHPDQPLVQPDADNVHLAGYLQDDWAVSDHLRLNFGLRYEMDTEVNNQSRFDQLNPIVLPFVDGERKRDLNNLGPRIGFAWSSPAASRLTIRGGYGIYYDRIVLEVQSLERGLDGRSLPIEVRAGNVQFLDPATGRLPPFAPTLSNPFTGFILPGAGASGINIIDSHLQSPKVQQFHLGTEWVVPHMRVRVDGLHDDGTDFLIGRTVGEVFNPVVGGPDRVVNIESSAKTKYDALLVSLEHDGSHYTLNTAYTLSRAMNYANDDQIPFLGGPIDPNDLARENGPTPNDRRHRVVVSGLYRAPGGVNVSGLWTMSSKVPMDIMMPDGSSRIPTIQRNAGARQFHTAAELNAFLTATNASGGINGVKLPLVSDTARFSDDFNSVDLRVSRPFSLGGSRIEPMVEVFNLLNTENILGTTNTNYSGFANVLVRDSEDPASPGYLTSTRFGTPVTPAGGVFGSGGPRAMQLAVRVTF
jgi:hypothetical protein